MYTREAHGHDDFESDLNVGFPFALSKPIDQHKTAEERRTAAVLLHAHTVGRCRLTVSNPVLKPPIGIVSALEATR